MPNATNTLNYVHRTIRVNYEVGFTMALADYGVKPKKPSDGQTYPQFNSVASVIAIVTW